MTNPPDGIDLASRHDAQCGRRLRESALHEERLVKHQGADWLVSPVNGIGRIALSVTLGVG
jgi:hypothetical protein